MAQQPTIVSGQNIIIPAPRAGDNVTITSSPSGNLTFEFDINSAEPSRVDNDLVLQTPEGSVTIGNFFAVGDESLPTLTLTDGVVVDATDFFDGSGVDMTTAAGPAGARADGSGTSYDDGAGALIDGVDRLGSLGNFHWGRDVEFGGDDLGLAGPALLTLDFTGGNGLLLDGQSINESEGGFNLRLNLDKPAAGTITVTIQMGGNATLLNNAVVDSDIKEYNSDVNLPTGPGYSYDPSSGLLTVTIPAGASQVTVPFELKDDHISFENNETLSFTVIGVTGPVVVEGAGTATITITDDGALGNRDGSSDIDEWDGPIVSVVAVQPDSAPEGGGPLEFVLDFKDPHNPLEDYKGFKGDMTPSGDMTLSQDMTIVLKSPGGDTAKYGEDYTFDLSHLVGKPGIASVDNIDGTITIVLYGRVDNAGDVRTETPFDLNDLPNLVIKVDIINDAITELVSETISLDVQSVSGNESQKGTGGTVTIDPDESGKFNGPTIFLKVEPIKESGAGDTPDQPKDNLTGKINISMKAVAPGDHAVAGEDVGMTLVIGGKASTSGNTATQGLNSGDRDGGTDYYLLDASGQEINWVPSGTLYTAEVTLTATGPGGATGSVRATYTFDPASGKTSITGFEMPAGCTEIDIPFAAKDDLFEKENEFFDVQLNLVEKDGSGLPYGEAKLDGKTPETSVTDGISKEGQIIDDSRTADGGPLNPETHDGPWVHLVADRDEVGESEGKNVKYTISLKDPAGTGSEYTAIEDVTVKLAISSNDKTFNLLDLFKPGVPSVLECGGFKYEITVTATGQDSDGYPVLTVKTQHWDKGTNAWISDTDPALKLNPQTGAWEFEVQVPQDSDKIELSIPINDDPLGADDSGNSKHDSSEETFTVEIVDVNGNEARVDTTAKSDGTFDHKTDVTIVDDERVGKDDPLTPGNEAEDPNDTLEGMKVGLESKVHKSGGHFKDGVLNFSEGHNTTIDIVLYDGNNNPITEAAKNNPYQGYTSHNGLPDATVITLTLGGTPSSGDDGRADLSYALTPGMRGLITTGKISVVVNGVELTTATFGNSIPAGAEVILTLKPGFNPSQTFDGKHLNFEVRTVGDNINEYDRDGNYKDNADAKDESFTIKIESVEGNETSLVTVGDNATLRDPQHTLTGDITDLPDGEFFWIKDSGKLNDTSSGWKFGVNVQYGNGKTSDEGNWQGANSQDPGEAVHVQVKFTDSDHMQHGEEYNVSGYGLFTSINKGTTISEGDFNAFLALNLSPAELLDLANGTLDTTGMSPADLAIINQFTGLVLVVGDDTWTSDANASNSYDLYIPKNHLGGNGTINFEVEKGDRAGTHANNSFTIELVDPKNPLDPNSTDMKGEIIKVDNTGVKDGVELTDNIIIKLGSDKTIHEDPDNGDNQHVYKVTFENGNSTPMVGAAGNIAFDILIHNRSATFDTDTTDNYLDSNVKDFAFANADGSTMEYSDAASLQTALQTYYDKYGNGNVTVKVDDSGSTLKLSFDVKEGFPLTDGIDIPFKSLDDSISDNNEKFDVQIGNIGSYIKGEGSADDIKDALKITLEKNQSSTTILDETAGKNAEDLNGFALSVKDGSGHEYAHNAGGVTMPVRAFSLDDYGRDGDATVRTKSDFDLLYKTFLDKNPGSAISLEAFILEYYAPEQPISFDIKVDDGSGTYGEDMMKMSGAKIVPDQWEVVIDGDKVYFEADFVIEAIDDHLSETLEDFDVTISNIKGNESRPVKDGEITDESTTAKGTIIDVHNGPTILSFGPDGGSVFEPIDFNHNGTPADPKSVNYSVSLDSAVTEATYVWLAINEGSGAEYGVDYVFGENVFWCDGSGKIYKLGADGLPVGTAESGMTLPDYAKAPSAPGGYFTIINENDASASFEVKILDDNDDKNVTGGIDSGLENIIIDIVDVHGGEVTLKDSAGNKIPYDPEACYLYTIDGKVGVVDPAEGTFTVYGKDARPTEYTFGDPANTWLGSLPTRPDNVQSNDNIEDDMFGPVVSFDVGGTVDPTLTSTIGLTMQDTATEDVKVTLNILDAHGNPLPSVEVTIGAGSTTGSFDLKTYLEDNNLTKADVFVSIGKVVGGEAVSGGGTLFVDYDSGKPPFITVESFTSTVITEGNLPGVEGTTVEYTLGVELSKQAWKGKLEPVSFTLKFYDGTATLDKDLVEGTYEDVTIVIGKGDLKALKDLKDPVGSFTIKEEGGKTVVTYKGNNGKELVLSEAKGTTITGKLPTAVGDDRLEGDENFETLIVSPSGSIDLDSAVTTTTIKDMTKFGLVFVDANGNLLDKSTFTEGVGEQTITAQLVVVDGEGNPILDGGNLIPVQTDHRLEFELDYAPVGPNGATENSDYSGSKVVVINKGESSGEFKLVITDDRITEEDETFTITGTITAESEKLLENGGVLDNLIPGKGTEITITDNTDGPTIVVDFNDSVKEDGSLVVTLGSYYGGVRTVVDEDVTSEFVLTPSGANPINLEEIASFEIDGNKYLMADIIANNGSADGKITLTGDPATNNWSLTINTTMNKGEAIDSFTINMQNDVKSEGDEGFHLEYIGSKDGETENSTAMGKDVTVEDVMNGPEVSIKAGTGNEDDLEVTLFITLDGNSGTLPTEEDATVTLTLSPEALAMLNGGKDDIQLTNGAVVDTFDPATGKLVIILPAGAAKDMEYGITFPIHDNSIKGGDSFSVSLNGVDGGEMSMVGMPQYSSKWAGEEGGSASHGGSITLAVEVEDLKMTEASGEVNFTLGGITDADLIQFIYLDGTRLEKETGWVIDNGEIIVKSDTIKAGYQIKVEFIKAPNEAVLKAIGEAKLNLNVKDTSLKGFTPEVNVPITDEQNTDDLDGPMVSVAFTDASFGDNTAPNDVSEDGTAYGKVIVELPNHGGDPSSTVQPIDIIIQVGANADGDSYPTLKGEDGFIFTHQGGGKYKVTVPEGTDATTPIELPFFVTGMGNYITGAPDLTIKVEKVTGGKSQSGLEYETFKPDENVESMTLVDGDTATNTAFTITGSGINEGGQGNIKISMPSDPSRELGNKVATVEVKLEGLKAGDEVFYKGSLLTPNANGNYEVEFTSGNRNAYLTIKSDHTDGVDKQTIKVSVVGSDMLESVSGSHEVTVTDVIKGTAGDDVLTIGDSNVIVDAGAGDDMISINAGAAYQGGSVFNGGVGFDSISYAGFTGGGIFADLANGQISFGNKTNPTWTDTIKNIEEFTGTGSGDEIHLGGGVTTVNGGAGNDRIFGSDADETIFAGTGNDLIYGGKGSDTMHAGDGQDTFAWKAADLGNYRDTIEDFKLGGTDGDKLQFDSSLEELISGAINALGGQVGVGRYEDTSSGNTFDITCEADSCTIKLGSDDGNQTQTIQLNNMDFGEGVSNTDDLALLIQAMIKIDAGG